MFIIFYGDLLIEIQYFFQRNLWKLFVLSAFPKKNYEIKEYIVAAQCVRRYC